MSEPSISLEKTVMEMVAWFVQSYIPQKILPRSGIQPFTHASGIRGSIHLLHSIRAGLNCQCDTLNFTMLRHSVKTEWQENECFLEENQFWERHTFLEEYTEQSFLSAIFIISIYSVHVCVMCVRCVCVSRCASGSQRTTCERDSFFSPYGSQKSKSSLQVWWQAPLSTEPYLPGPKKVRSPYFHCLGYSGFPACGKQSPAVQGSKGIHGV